MISRRSARSAPGLALAFAVAIGAPMVAGVPGAQMPAFDHHYARYGALLAKVVRGVRVDYATLVRERALLDAASGELSAVDAGDFAAWTRDRQLAYWINAYNLFTLESIADSYPIRGSVFSLYPRSSIRQIDDVWTNARWRAGGRTVSLDDIEHEILRPTFDEPRIHAAINCASVSCPPLRAQPFVAKQIDTQLDSVLRGFLASPHGLVVDGTTLRVSSIFKWYGADFVPAFESLGPDGWDGVERAVLGMLATYAPEPAASLARTGEVRLRYLRYDWSLNDVES